MCPCGQALIPKRQRIHANIHNLRRKVALYLRNSGLGLNFFIQREPRPHGSGTSVSSFRFSCPKSMQRAFSLLKARLFPARSFLSSPLFSLSKKPSFFAIYGNVTPYAQAGDCFWVILKPGKWVLCYGSTFILQVTIGFVLIWLEWTSRNELNVLLIICNSKLPVYVLPIFNTCICKIIHDRAIA